MIKKEFTEVSIYSGKLTNQVIAECSIKVKQAFQNLDSNFFDVFSDRIKDNNFNDERLKQAVNFVIDNCIYPTPTVAQFISFDKRFKTYTYHQIVKKLDEDKKAFENYRPVDLGLELEKPLWASVEDIAKYKLKTK